jgi:hypothetical protein
MYGAMANVNIVSSDVDTVVSGENSLGKVPMASFPAYTQIQYAGDTWMPLSNATGINKYFRFSLRDDYGRPYSVANGPPSITVLLENRTGF